MNKFSKRSLSKLETCHEDLQLIMQTAIEISNIDFGIMEGNRGIEKQQSYFKQGLSKIDGIEKKGKHNQMPSMAVDIYPFIDGKINYDNEHCSYLAGLIHAVTEFLYDAKKIKHKIRWGGNWDMDGTILIDQSFKDRPHYELINA